MLLLTLQAYVKYGKTNHNDSASLRNIRVSLSLVVPYKKFKDVCLFNVDYNIYNCPSTRCASAMYSGFDIIIGSFVSVNDLLVFDILVNSLESSDLTLTVSYFVVVVVVLVSIIIYPSKRKGITFSVFFQTRSVDCIFVLFL